ncbi:hypothetical protein EAF00_010077 [Botryotinia globosa]|nr:hypothetical protein EAF00_010077 [Botryotinia globosa]
MASPRKIDNLPVIAQRALDMQVLYLGLSHTSTMSLQESLNKLGYRTYHCRVAAPTTGHIPLWLESFDAKLNGNGKPFGREEFGKILTNFSEALPFHQLLLIALTDWSGGKPDDCKALRAGFIAHNEKIRRHAGGRLLEFSPKDGWEPLCNFLGKPVPNEPYPYVNAGDSTYRLFVFSMVLYFSIKLSKWIGAVVVALATFRWLKR